MSVQRSCSGTPSISSRNRLYSGIPVFVWTIRPALVVEVGNPLRISHSPLNPPLKRRVPPGFRASEIALSVEPSRLRFGEAVLALHVCLVVLGEDRVPSPSLALRVEQEHVVDAAILDESLLRVAVRGRALPDDLIAEV